MTFFAYYYRFQFNKKMIFTQTGLKSGAGLYYMGNKQ